MSTENISAQEEPQDSTENESVQTTALPVAYEAANTVSEDATKIHLFGNLYRDAVNLSARIRFPLRFREAMTALHRVVASDFRYVPKDRTAYLAYMRLKKESAGMGAWAARQEYFRWIARNDPAAWLILDPVVTVHPDGVLFEVFSRDEGSYACLRMEPEAFEFDGIPKYGTTNIDFSEDLVRGLGRMRNSHETRISVSREAVALKGEKTGEVLEKKINVPDSWLRGFLQVQSAATLAEDRFFLTPIDLYNIFRQLRFHADIKGKPRGLRIELCPGEFPRIVLEPWETLVETSCKPYRGKNAKVIRIWGRRRLMLVRGFLPFAEEMEVAVTGSGLPSFWILRAGEMRFTLGLSGFTASDWSRALSFDLLLPRHKPDTQDLEKILAHLSDHWFNTEKSISNATGLKGMALLKSLQTGCQQGSLMYDREKEVYRLRPLSSEALSMEKLEFRNARERFAHDLLNRKGAVTLESENRILGTGLELTGKVKVEEDRREYRPVLLLDEEGRVRKAECSCTFFRKQGLRHGPCPHLTALRVLHAQESEKRMKNQSARNRILLETRTYSRRGRAGENICQLTLDRHMLRMRFGLSGQSLRAQNLRFNTPDDARNAYFTRVDELTEKGYMDATV